MQREFREGELGQTHLLQMAMAWKGAAGPLGWGGLAVRLPKETRAPLAYVLGRRYRQLDRDQDAARFFQTAHDDASERSALCQMALKALAAVDKDDNK